MFPWWKTSQPERYVVYPKWLFDPCVISTGAKGDVRMMPISDEERLRSMETNLKANLRAVEDMRRSIHYPQFKTMRLRKGTEAGWATEALECEECKSRVIVVERGDKMLVACPTCNRCAECDVNFFRNVLKSGRVELPIR